MRRARVFEFIVAVLLRTGKLGGFDFNSRFYADDDLMVGSADPFQLFRIDVGGFVGVVVWTAGWRCVHVGPVPHHRT